MFLNTTLAKKMYEKFTCVVYKYRVVAPEASVYERFRVKLGILEHNTEVSYEIAA